MLGTLYENTSLFRRSGMAKPERRASLVLFSSCVISCGASRQVVQTHTHTRVLKSTAIEQQRQHCDSVALVSLFPFLINPLTLSSEENNDESGNIYFIYFSGSEMLCLCVTASFINFNYAYVDF